MGEVLTHTHSFFLPSDTISPPWQGGKGAVVLWRWRRGFLLDNTFLLLLGTRRWSLPQGEVGGDPGMVIVAFGAEEGEAAF